MRKHNSAHVLPSDGYDDINVVGLIVGCYKLENRV